MVVNRKLLLDLILGPDSEIVRYWDSDKGSFEASLAAVIRAFMRAHRILDAREGVRLFFALNPERLATLAGMLRPGPLPPAETRLAA